MTPLALVLALAAAPDPFAAFLAGPPALVDAGPAQRGEDALAVADGIVIAADRARVEVAHSLYDNHRRRDLVVHYGAIAPVVTVGARVARGQPLGRGLARVRWSLDGAEVTRDLVTAKPRFDPRAEARLVLVDQETYEMRVYTRAREERRVKVGFGQARGPKARQGDLKTPKGMYFVTGKHRGEFGGRWGAYYGGHWIKVSYPNPWDADRGLDQGWIDAEEARGITRAWRRRRLPTQKTPLGGGIGFHGWIGPWDDADPHLSWGCVVMHNPDIRALYDEIPVGAMVVIF